MDKREALEQFFTYGTIDYIMDSVEEGDIPEGGMELTLQIGPDRDLNGIDLE
jgi:hypothetical protein